MIRHDSSKDDPIIVEEKEDEVKVMNDDEDFPRIVAGRQKKASGYTAQEHLTLVNAMKKHHGSFNCKKDSESWKNMHRSLNTTRQSDALHGHFVEIYGCFKGYIMELPKQSKGKEKYRIPKTTVDARFDDYCYNLYNFINTDPDVKKKYWSLEVIQGMLELHLQYNDSYGHGIQDGVFLEEKTKKTESKYEQDQKNWAKQLKERKEKEKEQSDSFYSNFESMAKNSSNMTAAIINLIETSSNAAATDKRIALLEEKENETFQRLTSIEQKQDETSKNVKMVLELLMRQSN